MTAPGPPALDVYTCARCIVELDDQAFADWPDTTAIAVYRGQSLCHDHAMELRIALQTGGT